MMKPGKNKSDRFEQSETKPSLVKTLNEMRRKGATLLEQWERIQSAEWIELAGNPDKIIDIIPEWKNYLGVVKQIQALARDEDSLVRCTAAETLGNIGDKRAFPYLVQALKDINYRVRRESAEALGKLGDKQALPHLIQALNENKDHGFQKEIIQALGGLKETKALPYLIELLKNKNKELRIEAVKALGVLGDKEPIPSLIGSLKDQDYEVRENTINSLGNLGDREVIPYLKKVLKETQNIKIKKSAIKSIEQIMENEKKEQNQA